MRTQKKQIEVQGVTVEVVRKSIKNLHLKVYPPDGRVRISVPWFVDDQTVRLAVTFRLDWIQKHQERVGQQVRQSVREMVTGESHFFQGRRYQLQVVEKAGRPGVSLLNKTTIELQAKPGTDRDGREKILDHWYRQQLRQEIPSLVAQWEPRVGVKVAEWGIRKMKTRWGSCNVKAKRIWINLELAKKHRSYLAYILVHEMIHLLERSHNERFFALMDQHIPQWRTYKKELNSSHLAYE